MEKWNAPLVKQDERNATVAESKKKKRFNGNQHIFHR